MGYPTPDPRLGMEIKKASPTMADKFYVTERMIKNLASAQYRNVRNAEAAQARGNNEAAEIAADRAEQYQRILTGLKWAFSEKEDGSGSIDRNLRAQAILWIQEAKKEVDRMG